MFRHAPASVRCHRGRRRNRRTSGARTPNGRGRVQSTQGTVVAARLSFRCAAVTARHAHFSTRSRQLCDEVPTRGTHRPWPRRHAPLTTKDARATPKSTAVAKKTPPRKYPAVPNTGGPRVIERQTRVRITSGWFRHNSSPGTPRGRDRRRTQAPARRPRRRPATVRAEASSTPRMIERPASPEGPAARVGRPVVVSPQPVARWPARSPQPPANPAGVASIAASPLLVEHARGHSVSFAAAASATGGEAAGGTAGTASAALEAREARGTRGSDMAAPVPDAVAALLAERDAHPPAAPDPEPMDDDEAFTRGDNRW
jgi:hypothetical protein